MGRVLAGLGVALCGVVATAVTARASYRMGYLDREIELARDAQALVERNGDNIDAIDVGLLVVRDEREFAAAYVKAEATLREAATLH